MKLWKECSFSCDRTPLAPIGTEVMIHIKPTRRHTWGYPAICSWYSAPAMSHHYCIKVVTKASAIRITDTFRFLRHSLPEPTIPNTDRIVKATRHLIRTIEGQPDATPDELQAIQHLKDLITWAANSNHDSTTSEKIYATHPKEGSNVDDMTSTPIHISPDPTHSPLLATKNHSQPHVIPLDNTKYKPPSQCKLQYNLCSRQHNILSTIEMFGQANAWGIVVSAVIDTDTGNSLAYQQLIKHPKYKEVWTRSYANKLGRLTNGIRIITGT
jgi:hypothetical protein